MKKQSIRNNFIYQFLYQALLLVVPLLISPFLTRTLGKTSLGIYTYINSLAYYFVMFANLGIAKHGQRIIAKSSKNEEELRKKFWSLFCIHSFCSVLVLVIYFAVGFIFVSSDRTIFLIQSIYVASALFDITWLFYGLENFKSVVLKNAIVKIVECVLIFCFVKNSSSIIIYTFIACGSIFVGQIVMIPQALHIVKPIRFSWNDTICHLKPLLIFSISIIAVSLYTVFDKTLLGLLTTKENVAIYEYANKIIAIPRTFITIIGTVMFPRACKMASEGNFAEQRKYLNISLLVVAFIGMGSIFGLLSVSNQFAVIYYGNDFSESGNVMVAMCAIPLIIGLGDIVRTQYLIPHGKDKEYTLCIIINACLNIVLSFLLIPVIGIYGAVVGTCAAELFGCIYQIIICRKFVKLKDVVKPMIPSGLFGFFMYGVLKISNLYLTQSILSLVIKIMIGAVIYIVLSCLYLILFEKTTLKAFLKGPKKKLI